MLAVVALSYELEIKSVHKVVINHSCSTKLFTSNRKNLLLKCTDCLYVLPRLHHFKIWKFQSPYVVFNKFRWVYVLKMWSASHDLIQTNKQTNNTCKHAKKKKQKADSDIKNNYCHCIWRYRRFSEVQVSFSFLRQQLTSFICYFLFLRRTRDWNVKTGPPCRILQTRKHWNTCNHWPQEYKFSSKRFTL